MNQTSIQTGVAELMLTPEHSTWLQACQPSMRGVPWAWVLVAIAACSTILVTITFFHSCMKDTVRCVVGCMCRNMRGACGIQLELSAHSRSGAYLWTVAILQCLCGLTWFWPETNPHEGLRIGLENTADLDKLDADTARDIVASSRWVGLLVYVTVAAALCAVAIFGQCTLKYTSWTVVDLKRDSQKRAALVLFESTATVAMLALVFWRSDFALAYQARDQTGGGLAVLLKQKKGETASVIFSTKLLLAWLAPLLATARLTTSCAVDEALSSMLPQDWVFRAQRLPVGFVIGT
eukprot:6474211-Amphidinium_carterae.1